MGCRAWLGAASRPMVARRVVAALAAPREVSRQAARQAVSPVERLVASWLVAQLAGARVAWQVERLAAPLAEQQVASPVERLGAHPVGSLAAPRAA